MQSSQKPTIGAISLYFLRLGATTFGGPAAHLAIMRADVVERRRWLSEAEYLDLIGASNLLPGPTSTEVVMHIGYRTNGYVGLMVAGTVFIMPAAFMTLVLAIAYMRFGHLPDARYLLHGLKPAVLAIIAHAVWSLAKTAWKTTPQKIVGAAALAAGITGLGLLPIIAIGGAFTSVSKWSQLPSPRSRWTPIVVSAIVAATLLSSLSHLAFGLIASSRPTFFNIATEFLKLGSATYGSGYVLLAFLQSDLVNRLHWLTQGKLLDSITAGQFTPGPVFTSATFIGYLLAGFRGAAYATAGMFLPAFILVALTAPYVAAIRRSVAAGAFLDGINAASTALIASATVLLARGALVDAPTVAEAIAALAILMRTKINPTWLILGGAAFGLAVR